MVNRIVIRPRITWQKHTRNIPRTHHDHHSPEGCAIRGAPWSTSSWAPSRARRPWCHGRQSNCSQRQRRCRCRPGAKYSDPPRGCSLVAHRSACVRERVYKPAAVVVTLNPSNVRSENEREREKGSNGEYIGGLLVSSCPASTHCRVSLSVSEEAQISMRRAAASKVVVARRHYCGWSAGLLVTGVVAGTKERRNCFRYMLREKWGVLFEYACFSFCCGKL